MQKVISINLNGIAFQLDESGYETLHEYLARAERQLQSNPDRAEIMADLEQAIADKCQAYLGPHKNVIAAAEIEKVVAEMGPVDPGSGESTGEVAGDAAAGSGGHTREAAPRRLFRIPTSDGAGSTRGAMIGGVCAGLAAYFQIDVTLVRIAFVIAAFLTKGFAIAAYIVMMFVIPEASTAEERAAAAGAPFNAKEVVDRVRKRSADTGRELRRQWRRQQRAWRRGWWPAGAPYYGPPPAALGLLPVFAIAQMALFLVAISMLISLVNTRAILSWRLPDDVPLWGAALGLLIVYQVAVSPLRAARHWAAIPAGTAASASVAFWHAVAWLTGLAFAIWLASDHIPEIREFLRRVPELVRDFALAMRDLVQRLGAE